MGTLVTFFGGGRDGKDGEGEIKEEANMREGKEHERGEG